MAFETTRSRLARSYQLRNGYILLAMIMLRSLTAFKERYQSRLAACMLSVHLVNTCVCHVFTCNIECCWSGQNSKVGLGLGLAICSQKAIKCVMLAWSSYAMYQMVTVCTFNHRCESCESEVITGTA